MVMGNWVFFPVPSPQSPVPSPQSPVPNHQILQIAYFGETFG
ncbi:hypothetical protein [Sphaerospermopsis sp. FACHB-1194]|nr:hypothetical protein [Sphaerospermopsis sp. FACHB-1194]